MTTRNDLREKYRIDPKLAGHSGRRRLLHERQLVSKARTTSAVLAEQDGAVTPKNRSYLDDYTEAVPWPSIVHIDGQPVHLHQRIREDTSDNPLLDDGETVEWTVVRLTEDTVVMRNQPDWKKKREVSHETFAEDFKPLTVDDGRFPKLAY